VTAPELGVDAAPTLQQATTINETRTTARDMPSARGRSWESFKNTMNRAAISETNTITADIFRECRESSIPRQSIPGYHDSASQSMEKKMQHTRKVRDSLRKIVL
jgi:hypothetical protein